MEPYVTVARGMPHVKLNAAQRTFPYLALTWGVFGPCSSVNGTGGLVSLVWDRPFPAYTR